jgi:hypothetical protein
MSGLPYRLTGLYLGAVNCYRLGRLSPIVDRRSLCEAAQRILLGRHLNFA